MNIAEISDHNQLWFKQTLDSLGVERDVNGNPPIFQRAMICDCVEPTDMELNMQNEFGNTLLHMYIKNPTQLEYLLKRGANVNLWNHIGWTPLTLALSLNCGARQDTERIIEAVEILVKYEAIVTFYNYRQIQGWELSSQRERLLQICSNAVKDETVNVDEIVEEIREQKEVESNLKWFSEMQFDGEHDGMNYKSKGNHK